MDKPVEIEVSLGSKGPSKITPKTVDSATFLRVALGYVDYLEELSRKLGVELHFTGVEVRPGSAAAAFNPDDERAAQLVENTGLRLLRGREEVSAELEPAVKRMRAVLQVVPDDLDVHITTTKKTKIRIAAGPEIAPTRAWERASFYGQLVTIGGKRPVARFLADLEGDYLIPLVVTREKAPKLGALLYQQLHVEAEIARSSATGEIVRGELVDYKEVAKEGGVSKWRQWFAETVKTFPTLEEMLDARHKDLDEKGEPE